MKDPFNRANITFNLGKTVRIESIAHQQLDFISCIPQNVDSFSVSCSQQRLSIYLYYSLTNL